MQTKLQVHQDLWMDSTRKNIFEVVGNLIASLEMDDQDGVKKCLGDLKIANEHITTETGVLGGRQNRLEFALDAHGKARFPQNHGFLLFKMLMLQK